MQSIQSWDGPCNVMTRSKTSTYGLSLTLINTWTQINYITSLVPDSSYILCWYPGAGILELCNALHCFGQFEAGHDSNFKQQKYLQQLSLQKIQKLESSNPHMLGTISLPSRHTKKGCFFSLSRIKYDQTPFLPTTGKTLCSNAQYHCIHS